MSSRHLLAAVVATMALSACALTEDRVNVVHHRPLGVPELAVAGDPPVDIMAQDKRGAADPTIVASKINGYGIEMAAIRWERPVEQIVDEALAAELTARGFAMGAGGNVLKVEVRNFHNEFHAGFWAHTAEAYVSLGVEVIDGTGGSVFGRAIVGRASETAPIANGANTKAALEAALADAIARLMADEKFLAALRSSPSTAVVARS